MAITIIGYRGSGKSSIARPLAKMLGWKTVDSDDLIEERAGKTIKEIFEDEGEPAFRQLEKDILTELLNEEELIIAAGGGAILNPQSRELMKQSGPVVWLQATIQELSERIAADSQTETRRPDLTPLGVREEIEEVLNHRVPMYEEAATMIIITTGKTPEEIATEVYSLLPAECFFDDPKRS